MAGRLDKARKLKHGLLDSRCGDPNWIPNHRSKLPGFCLCEEVRLCSNLWYGSARCLRACSENETRPTQSPKLDESAGVSERSLSRLIEIVTEGIAVWMTRGGLLSSTAAQRSCLAMGEASCAENRLKYFCQSAFDTMASIWPIAFPRRAMRFARACNWWDVEKMEASFPQN
jgi:hypothetical protein